MPESGEPPRFDGWRDAPKAPSGLGQSVILVGQLTHRINGAVKITEAQNGAEVRVLIRMSDSLIGVLLHRGARVFTEVLALSNSARSFRNVPTSS